MEIKSLILFPKLRNFTTINFGENLNLFLSISISVLPSFVLSNLNFMSAINHVFVLLGGNIEPRMKYIIMAQQKLQSQLGSIDKISSVYQTDAWGFNSNKKFLNMVLLMKTKLDAESFLKGALQIELELGRQRLDNENYSSRTIDIDILYFNSDIIESKDLVVPHPRLHLRKFTLIPLIEIAADFIHPLLKKTNKKLLTDCDDKVRVTEFIV